MPSESTGSAQPIRLYRNYRYGSGDNWSTECDPGVLNADHYVEFDGKTLRVCGRPARAKTTLCTAHREYYRARAAAR